MKRIKLLMASLAMGFTVLTFGQAPAQAAAIPATPLAAATQQAADKQTQITPAQYRDGWCYRNPWHWRCRGYGRRHYRRHHDDHYSGRRCRYKWNQICANRWGWGTRRFNRCVRRHC